MKTNLITDSDYPISMILLKSRKTPHIELEIHHGVACDNLTINILNPNDPESYDIDIRNGKLVIDGNVFTRP
mgnify:CR=1 FL=1